ncbi:MAG: response regulator [Desulfobacterales bacterium]|nr:response regulator [Desulfobacterales bacterium]
MERLKILVVDDEKVICSGCRMVLSDLGHTVDTRKTCKEGLDAIQNQDYHLVLLDMKLPDSDGMEILKTARIENSGMYIIVMTGYATIRNAVSAMRLGAFDYLPKPFTDEELIASVERALENGVGCREIK